MLPFSLQEAKAVEHKTPPNEAKPFTKEDGDNPGSGSTSASYSYSSAASSPTSHTSTCISYNPSSGTFRIFLMKRR
ncbi:MAG: hypothetical protein M3044_03565 [Thermoproteota archaeon]|nr:hypothetical protein [Thermoproteota archaeon]